MTVMLLCLFCSVPVLAAESPGNYWSPWVTQTTTTGATINWQQGSAGTATIAYATADYYSLHHAFDHEITDSSVSLYHHITLTGLEPGTAYQYHVSPSGHAGVFGTRMFRTMPASGPFTFIVISDPQEGHNYTEMMRFKYVADAIAQEPDVLFILVGGDYAGHDSEGLWNTFFQVADPMLANATLFPTIGNHEYHNASGGDNPPSGALQYHAAYDVPLNYSFDCANVRFVILDTPDPGAADGDDPHTSLTLAMSQESWLREQLDNNLAGTFTMHHHPIWDYYNTSDNPDLQPWETLYHTYNISATFAGHTHNYQRYSVMGIPYFIVGNAGGRCADINASDPTHPVWYRFGDTRKLGYLRVSVDPANNTATAQEIFVASVQEDDSDETPAVYDPPVIADTITFPLSTRGLVPVPEPVPYTGDSSSTGFADAGRPSSYLSGSPGSPAGRLMVFTINQTLTPNAPGAFISVTLLPAVSLGPTQMTLADASSIDRSPLAGRQTVYIASIDLVGVNPSAISQSSITFAVAGSWLSQHGVKPQDIVLMRNHDGQWSELKTSFDHQAGDTYFFTATASGFSSFAITTRAGRPTGNATVPSATPAATLMTGAAMSMTPALVPGEIPVTSPVASRTTQVPAPGGEPAGATGSPFPAVVSGIIVIIIVAAGGFCVRRWWIRRKNPALFRDKD
jgi:hypothetical protein